MQISSVAKSPQSMVKTINTPLIASKGINEENTVQSMPNYDSLSFRHVFFFFISVLTFMPI